MYSVHVHIVQMYNFHIILKKKYLKFESRYISKNIQSTANKTILVLYIVLETKTYFSPVRTL
jgi:hypothetical protein